MGVYKYDDPNEAFSEAEGRIRRALKNNESTLNLNSLGLTELPASLSQLIHLQELDLSYNQLTVVPDSLGGLADLQVLDLRDNRLTTLPESLGQLTQLERLDLAYNQLALVPGPLRQFTRLKKLELGFNQLTDIPDFLHLLVRLEALSITENHIAVLPQSIGELSHLQRLFGGRNLLETVPEFLGQLLQLKGLYLHGNKLETIPEFVGQWVQLRELVLAGNPLASLPASLGRLDQLRTLRLGEIQLAQVPEFIGRLTELRDLQLDENQLTSLPDFIGDLVHLQRLYLDGNRLSTLPDSIGRLADLQDFWLQDNELSTLPAPMRDLSKLRKLYLHGNDGLGLPVEILGPTSMEVTDHRAEPARPADILDYYFRVRVGRKPLNEAKLILVGRGGVGKTSLVNRLLHSRFDLDEKRTEGICISEWKLHLQSKEEVRLNLWDFGGQEIMHATHQFFLTQRSLYLLVLEGRQGAEDADAEYWLKLIESFGTESGGEVSPVLIVLNKIKANPFDLNRWGLQQKYPFVRAFITTDCEDGTGIRELRVAIEHQTDQLKHLRDSFPAAWFAIKDKLAAMKKKVKRNFLRFGEYRDLCAAHGERDAASQDSLARHLHDLGIALNYRDDPRLRDTHVLNPHWVTNGIYKILNAPLLARQKGELGLMDVGQILDPADYPRDVHRFLFDLMKKFELCFSFPDSDAHYLIPELLDKQEPTETREFPQGECLNFEYRYPVLPEGLLPRFIVRTHALSMGLPRWRTGAVLAFEGNRALVKADVQDKRVCIAVGGPSAGRRRLLAIIRSDFERIHSDIRQLKPEALVPLRGRPTLAIRYSKLLAFEEKGKRTFDEELNGDVIEINVQELLNGVDIEGARKRGETAAEQRVRLFFSYSHKDEMLRNELETHLKLLQRVGLIESWHDRKIEASEDWKRQIDENLEQADIILLLVSADFIASEYCYEKEMKRALARHNLGEARVIPVIVRDVNWARAPFAKLQALPKDARAVMEWSSKDAAWRNVSEGIERVVEQIQKERW